MVPKAEDEPQYMCIDCRATEIATNVPDALAGPRVDSLIFGAAAV
jgi:hypothetical protein